jgi:AcrR family transcriptional regulator
MSASRTARERVRAELTREITDIARRQLATEGAAGLSLRAIAREMGMVSSAIHRYFPTKDALLTALIIDGYNAVGAAAERADAARDRADFGGRWLAICRAVRDWALAHPHEYALLYGSPVPGYAAPPDTVAAAIRDTVVLGRLATEAHEAGALDPPDDHPAAEAFAADADRLREFIPNVPDATIARAVTAWTALYGWISFELFGQFNNVILDRGPAFDQHVHNLAHYQGLPDPRPGE